MIDVLFEMVSGTLLVVAPEPLARVLSSGVTSFIEVLGVQFSQVCPAGCSVLFDVLILMVHTFG